MILILYFDYYCIIFHHAIDNDILQEAVYDSWLMAEMIYTVQASILYDLLQDLPSWLYTTNTIGLFKKSIG